MGADDDDDDDDADDDDDDDDDGDVDGDVDVEVDVDDAVVFDFDLSMGRFNDCPASPFCEPNYGTAEVQTSHQVCEDCLRALRRAWMSTGPRNGERCHGQGLHSHGQA